MAGTVKASETPPAVPEENAGTEDAPAQSEQPSPMRVTVPGVITHRAMKPMSAFDPDAYEFLQGKDIQISPNDGTTVVRAASRDEALGIAANIIAVAGGDFEVLSSYDETTSEEDLPSWQVAIRRKE